MNRHGRQKKRYRYRSILRPAGILAAVYIGSAGFAFLWSDRIIFQPPPPSYRDGPDIIKIPMKDGSMVPARYRKHPSSIFTILYSHGNAEDIGDVGPLLELFVLRGFSVLTYDYGGYGISRAETTEARVYEDVKAAYDYLVQEAAVPSNRIVVVGRSLGNGPSIHLASERPAAALILESPFLSAYRVATHFPLIPFDKFPNHTTLLRVRCPVLVIHGKKDKVIPFRHGKALFEQAGHPKFHLWVDEAGHYDVMERAGSRYWKAWAEVLRATDLADRNRQAVEFIEKMRQAVN